MAGEADQPWPSLMTDYDPSLSDLYRRRHYRCPTDRRYQDISTASLSIAAAVSGAEFSP